MDELITEQIDDLQLITPSHSLIIKENQEVTAFADRERLIQVITNLITNAVKYSPEANQVIIGLTVKNNEVICSIQDFGKGIPEEQYVNIFERFRQVNHSDMNIGLGLGLYISKEIVVMQGGRIWFESKENVGSTFYFSLPLLR